MIGLAVFFVLGFVVLVLICNPRICGSLASTLFRCCSAWLGGYRLRVEQLSVFRCKRVELSKNGKCILTIHRIHLKTNFHEFFNTIGVNRPLKICLYDLRISYSHVRSTRKRSRDTSSTTSGISRHLTGRRLPF